jgi:hypothetical protein
MVTRLELGLLSDIGAVRQASAADGRAQPGIWIQPRAPRTNPSDEPTVIDVPSFATKAAQSGVRRSVQ